MQRRARAALAAVSLLALSLASGGEEPRGLAPLHAIATENHSPQPIAAQAPARVRLASADAQALAEALGVDLPAGQSSFEYVIGEYPQLRGAGSRTWLEATFIIDFDEPEFAPLRTDLAAHGQAVTRPQLVEFVAGLIEVSDDRAWDPASVVVRRRRGDCSEHAVLTAALARMQGIPARVVVGVALLSNENDFGAFGHAWAEVHEAGKWQVADAALFDVAATVRYLPLGLLEDEGMGYGMGLARLMRAWIDRVVVLGSP